MKRYILLVIGLLGFSSAVWGSRYHNQIPERQAIFQKINAINSQIAEKQKLIDATTLGEEVQSLKKQSSDTYGIIKNNGIDWFLQGLAITSILVIIFGLWSVLKRRE